MGESAVLLNGCVGTRGLIIDVALYCMRRTFLLDKQRRNQQGPLTDSLSLRSVWNQSSEIVFEKVTVGGDEFYVAKAFIIIFGSWPPLDPY